MSVCGISSKTQADRQRRMRGIDEQANKKKPSHVSADDLADGFILDKDDRRLLSYKVRLKISEFSEFWNEGRKSRVNNEITNLFKALSSLFLEDLQEWRLYISPCSLFHCLCLPWKSFSLYPIWTSLVSTYAYCFLFSCDGLWWRVLLWLLNDLPCRYWNMVTWSRLNKPRSASPLRAGAPATRQSWWFSAELAAVHRCLYCIRRPKLDAVFCLALQVSSKGE